MEGFRTVIEKKELSDDLFFQISISPDESIVYVNFDYMDGKFTIEKVFKNNTFDLEEMSKQIGRLDTVVKIRRYLNLGELNDSTEEI